MSSRAGSNNRPNGGRKKGRNDKEEQERKRAIRYLNKKYKREMEPSNNTKKKKQKVEAEGDKDKKPEALSITDDVDFDRHDYDGRIARYEQRIKEGHSKYAYELKIAEMKAAKQAKM